MTSGQQYGRRFGLGKKSIRKLRHPRHQYSRYFEDLASHDSTAGEGRLAGKSSSNFVSHPDSYEKFESTKLLLQVMPMRVDLACTVAN